MTTHRKLARILNSALSDRPPIVRPLASITGPRPTWLEWTAAT
jgi:hypothetical protein